MAYIYPIENNINFSGVNIILPKKIGFLNSIYAYLKSLVKKC
jgi:hypothetical protein